MKPRTAMLLILSVPSVMACSDPAALPDPADRIFSGGAVYTVNEDQPWAEAVAVDDGVIVFVGSGAGVSAYLGEDTEVIDLGGGMLLPGFHDSHIHILIGVMAEEECSLLRLETLDAVSQQLAACTGLSGLGEERWITGGGWSEWLWPAANPDKALLDALFPDRPVYLESSFGHSAWVNSRALAIAGVDGNTPDPPAGVIERDATTGEPSGTLRDAAMLLVKERLPQMTIEQKSVRVAKGIELAHRNGITAVIEPGMDEELLEPVLALEAAGRFDLRALISLSPINWQPGVFDDEVFAFLEKRDAWRRPNIGVDSVKVYMDGVIEYGTSPLLEPYADPAYGSGEFFYSQDAVDRYLTRFDAMGLSVHVHAIGDAAIRRTLDGFAAARAANGKTDNRHHIVHLQLIDPADVPRFGELDVTATFQSLWAYPDPAALELDIPMLGEARTFRMYPIGSVHAAGGRIAGGSDYFVTDLYPLHAIEVAVTRRDPYTNAGPVLNETERVDLATMIEAYTINGAYLMGLEDRQGSIEVGKRADFVALDRNLFELPPAEINDATVTMTVFDGRTVYDARQQAPHDRKTN